MNAEDKEVLEKWVATLRSGDYEQGVGRLRRPDERYCCLGVLCDILEPNGWKRFEAGDAGFEYWQHLGEVAYPAGDSKAAEFLERTGLESGRLTDLNDGAEEIPRQDFAGIANYIEQTAK